MVNTILNYIKQPSTWRGIIALLGASGLLVFTPETADKAVDHIVAVVSGVLGLIGTINVIRNENKKA